MPMSLCVNTDVWREKTKPNKQLRKNRFGTLENATRRMNGERYCEKYFVYKRKIIPFFHIVYCEYIACRRMHSYHCMPVLWMGEHERGIKKVMWKKWHIYLQHFILFGGFNSVTLCGTCKIVFFRFCFVSAFVFHNNSLFLFGALLWYLCYVQNTYKCDFPEVSPLRRALSLFDYFVFLSVLHMYPMWHRRICMHVKSARERSTRGLI